MAKPRTILDYFSVSDSPSDDKSRVPHRRPPIKFRTLDDFQFPASLHVSAPRELVTSSRELVTSSREPVSAPAEIRPLRRQQNSLPTIAEDAADGIVFPPPPNQPRILCYTDGSCIHNGSPNAKGAYAVYFPNAEFANVSEKFINKPTNQRCELMAIFKALRMFADYYSKADTQTADITKADTPKADMNKAVLYTDSEYSLKCIQQYCKKWSHNGWLKADRKPIENRDIIQPLYELYSQPHVWKNVELRHIRSHTGRTDIHSQSNEVVDMMAKKALGGT